MWSSDSEESMTDNIPLPFVSLKHNPLSGYYEFDVRDPFTTELCTTISIDRYTNTGDISYSLFSIYRAEGYTEEDISDLHTKVFQMWNPILMTMTRFRPINTIRPPTFDWKEEDWECLPRRNQ